MKCYKLRETNDLAEAYIVSLSTPILLPTDIMHNHFLANPLSPLVHQISDKHNFSVTPPLSALYVIKGQPLKPLLVLVTLKICQDIVSLVKINIGQFGSIQNLHL